MKQKLIQRSTSHDTTNIDIFLGLDVGKSDHWACTVTQDGTKIWNKTLPNDEAKLTAAIGRWNTVYLERATNAVGSHHPEFDDALLQYHSPPGWEHINLTGDYIWRNNVKPGTSKFRRLRPTKRPWRTIFSIF